MNILNELKYLKPFYQRALKSPYFKQEIRQGCSLEEIKVIIASQPNYLRYIPDSFLEYLQFFGKDTGFRHHVFTHYIEEGKIYFDGLSIMGNTIERKKLEENVLDTNTFSNFFFFYNREFSLFYCFSNQESDDDPYIYEYREIEHLQKFHLRFTEFLLWLVEAFDHDVRNW